MHDATVGGRADAFASPDLTVFCRLDELGLVVTGQRLEPDRAVLACQVVEPDQWCRRCGCEGRPRDTVVRRLAHEPPGWRPTTLEVDLAAEALSERTAQDQALSERTGPDEGRTTGPSDDLRLVPADDLSKRTVSKSTGRGD